MLHKVKKRDIRKLNLTEIIYNFLNLNTESIESLLATYGETDTDKLYNDLRKEHIIKSKRSGTICYRREIVPTKNWEPLYQETKKYFLFDKKKKIGEEWKELDWPASDRYTFGDFIDNDASEPYIFGTFFEKKNENVSNKTGVDRYGYILDEESFNYMPFVNSIYMCFVIPYVLAKHSISYNSDIPKGCFIFIYRGGGAGSLIKTDCGNIAASCGHTFDYDYDQGYMIKENQSILRSDENKKQYLIMLNDGTLAIVSNYNVYVNDQEGRKKVHNDDFDIDAGIATVIKPKLDDSYYLNIYDFEKKSSDDSLSIRCYGSPSVVTRSVESKNTCLVGKLPKVKSNYCKWHPMYFHPKEGIVENENINTYNFYHDALVWQGMSGGPIIDNETQTVLGFHHSSQDDKFGVGIRADKLQLIFKNHISEINGPCTSSNSRNNGKKTKKIRASAEIRKSKKIEQIKNNVKAQQNKLLVESHLRRSSRRKKPVKYGN